MWLIALLLLMSPQTALSVAEPPSLIVQIVDPTWLPVPSADVRVIRTGKKAESKFAQTEYDGNAKFWIQGDADYTIEANYPGFKTKRLKHVYLAKNSSAFPTAYIQIRLQLDRPITVY